MANKTGDPRGPGMPGSGGFFHTQDDGPAPVILGPTGEVDLSFDAFEAGYGIYVPADSKLQIQAVSQQTATLILQYAIQLPEGRVLVAQETFAVGNSRVPAFFSRQLAEGVLLSVSVAPQANAIVGAWTYVNVGVSRANLGATNSFIQLCAGYISQFMGAFWPGGIAQRPNDGTGALPMVPIATPAAGADFTQTVPTNARWRIQSLRGILTTAVAAGNRTVRLAISNAGSFFYASAIGPAQAASLVTEYDFAPIGTAPIGTPPSAVQIHIPDNLIIRAGDALQSVTAGIQAADQWGSIFMLLQEWGDNF